MKTTGSCLTVAEVCRRLGVSRKALRLYEARGLIEAGRTPAEWRVYGPAQIARLHQVLALKRFGFALHQVAEILNGQAPDIPALLAVHAQVVQGELADLQRAAYLLETAQNKLARQGSLSTDDLIFLTKETIMTQKRSEGLGEIYDRIAAKHLSPADGAALSRDGVPVMLRPDADWPALHADAGRLMAIGDPASIEAMDLAKRWMTKVFEGTGGDPALTRKARDVARELHDAPAYQAVSSSSNAMMDFIQKAYGAAIAAGIMPKP